VTAIVGRERQGDVALLHVVHGAEAYERDLGDRSRMAVAMLIGTPYVPSPGSAGPPTSPRAG
jgi:hypothetical protein